MNIVTIWNLIFKNNLVHLFLSSIIMITNWRGNSHTNKKNHTPSNLKLYHLIRVLQTNVCKKTWNYHKKI